MQESWHPVLAEPVQNSVLERKVMVFLLKGGGAARRIPGSRLIILLLMAAPVAGVLVGCSKPDLSNASNAAANMTVPMRMPPAIVASHTYRCVGGDVQIGRATVCTPVTNENIVCRML